MKTLKILSVVIGLSHFLVSCATEPQAEKVYAASGFAYLIDTAGGRYGQSKENRDILVTIEGTNLQTYTDSTGYFTIDNIPTNKHTSYFYKDGYGLQRSTEKNLTYYFHSADDSHHTDFASFRVELFPLSPLKASIDSLYYSD